MKNKVEKLLSKSKLSEAYESLPDAALKQQILNEYAGLLSHNDLSNKMLRQHQTASIYPAIAVHQVLHKNGYTKAQSFELIRKCVLNSVQPTANKFRRAGKLPFFFALLRIMCPASMKSFFGEAGWDMQQKANTSAEIRWDCHSCYYHNEFSRYQMPELTLIYCECDDILYGHIPGVKWGRTKTIGRGAALCDFCFFNTKRLKQ